MLRFRHHSEPASLQKEHASSNPEVGDNRSSFNWSVFKRHLNSVYQFSRPYTIIGTIVQIISVSYLPVETVDDLSLTFFIGVLQVLVPTALANFYVAALNQLFDVELDKVNKPFLPLASGDLSMKAGITYVAASLLMSVGMGFLFQSPPILASVLISSLLGSAYSIDLPYLRWKKQPVLTAISILIVRAVVFPLSTFIHIQKYVLEKPMTTPVSLVFTIAIMCFLAISIAVIKDIPDADGDGDFGIKTFSVRLGREKVFWLCVNMLLLAYGTAVMVGASSPFLLSKIITMLGHSTLALRLWRKAQSIDLTNNKSTLYFYMFIWKLFYAEYFLIPFVR